MFSIEPYQWDSFHCLRVRMDQKEEVGFALCPEKGMSLLDLNFSGNQVLDGFSTSQELADLSWMKNTLLFPFPNRLKKGAFSYKKNDYQFPINDTEFGHAIHGFIAQQTFEIIELADEDDVASITGLYEHPSNGFDYFPFPFRMEVKYSIDKNEVFTIEFKVHNLSDDKIPMGFGWHPYFRLDKKVEDTRLKMPEVEWVELDKKRIPTGKRKPYSEFQKYHKLKDTELDDCFEITENGSSVVTKIKGEQGKIFLEQPIGEGQFNFLQVFTPPKRKSIAIEPMTCNVDAFNNKDGLIRLMPGEEWRSWIRVEYRKF